MGTTKSTLTSWELEMPIERVSESRLRGIRTLTVSSAEVGRLLADKSSSMSTLELIIFNTDISPDLQDRIADHLCKASATKLVEFVGMNPMSALVDSVLSLPKLYSVTFKNVLLNSAVPALLSDRLPKLPMLRRLCFDNVLMPPGTRKLISDAVDPNTCVLVMTNIPVSLRT